MKNLKFKRLLVKSNTLKAGNQFEFHDGLNLVTGSQNSIGKSTLVKLLFWTFGCEPSFDTAWKNCDCETFLIFSIEDDIYFIRRYKNIIWGKLSMGDSQFTEYSKISGDFSQRINSLFDFNVLLKQRNKSVVTSPPPAFFFYPFYLDQKRSWSKACDNFDKLGQFEKWQQIVIKFHVGLLNRKYFNLESEKASALVELEDVTKELDSLDVAEEVVGRVAGETFVTISEGQLREITEEISTELRELTENQEKLYGKVSSISSEAAYLKSQIVLTKKMLKSLDADYKFSVENIEEDEIECPLCGVVHDNSVLNRSSILADKSQAEDQLNDLESKLTKTEKRKAGIDEDIETIEKRVNEINEKYTIDNGESAQPETYLQSVGSAAINRRIESDRKNSLVAKDKFEGSIKETKREQKQELKEIDSESINSYFSSNFQGLVEELNAGTINLAEINSVLDYNKIVREGGAADGVRAILAYYITVYRMIKKFSSEVVAPFVIDTPNQHEQSDQNYKKTVDLLVRDFTEDEQMILCAMDDPRLQAFSENAHVIRLGSDKILKKDKYIEVSAFINSVIS